MDDMAQEPSLTAAQRDTRTLARAFYSALDTLPEPPRLSVAQSAFEAFTGALNTAPEPRRQPPAQGAIAENAPNPPARAARSPANAEKRAAPLRQARKARTPRKAPQQAQTGNGAAAAA